MMFVTKASERGGNIQYPVMKNICKKKRQWQYSDLKNIFKTRQTRGLGKQHGHLVEEAGDNLAQGSFQVGACTFDILMLVMRKRRKKMFTLLVMKMMRSMRRKIMMLMTMMKVVNVSAAERSRAM